MSALSMSQKEFSTFGYRPVGPKVARDPFQCVSEAATQAVGEVLVWLAGWETLPHNLLGGCHHCENWKLP